MLTLMTTTTASSAAPAPSSALNSARAHLDAAKAAAGDLRDEYDRGPVPGQSARVAAHHNAIRFGLKAAEVEGLLAIASALEGLLARPQGAEVVLLDAGTLHHPACEARGDFDGLECSHGCDTRAALAARAPSTTTLRERLDEARATA